VIGPLTQAESLLADAETSRAQMELILRHHSAALARDPRDPDLERQVELAEIQRSQAHHALRMASRL
jgi:hypothetical protein